MVITGGTTGLGLESAKRLALAGSSVFITARSASKGREAVSAIEEYARERGGKASVVAVTLELCDLSDVK